MINELDKEQSKALDHATNQCLGSMFDAINNNDYDSFLKLLRKDEFDINNWASGGYTLQATLTTKSIPIRSGFTPMAHAVFSEKPILVELFLLMGANPYAGNSSNNPINFIQWETGNQESCQKINNILRQYQNIALIDDPLNPSFTGLKSNFIEAIKNGDHLTVDKILSEGLIYTDQCCHNITSNALALAVESKSFDMVASLVQRGAAISDCQVRLLLQTHAEEPWTQSITNLLKLEKKKQVTIMELFCLAKGNLDASCRKAINEINEQYKKKVHHLKNNNVVSMEWDNYETIQRSITSVQNNTMVEELETVVDTVSVDQPYTSPIAKIQALKDYGLKLKQDKLLIKGDRTIEIANEVHSLVLDFYNKKIDKKEAGEKITTCIKEGRKTLGKDRNIADILAHICLALTGIGLIIMSVNKLRYGSFFLNSTKRQTLLDDINNDEILADLDEKTIKSNNHGVTY